MAAHTASWTKFQESWTTIEHLKELRELTEYGVAVSHAKRESLNKAGMVFIVTTWEAYIEDVTREAADHIATHAKVFDDLPHDIRSAISGGVRENPPKWQVKHVTGEGWRNVVRENAENLSVGSAFNTPSSEKVKELISKAIGLRDVTASWSWQGNAHPKPANKLDETIGIRGDIVHTGTKPEGLSKGWMTNYGGNICRLVDRTDNAIRDHAYGVTGIAMPDCAVP